jgi:hypothetical protein
LTLSEKAGGNRLKRAHIPFNCHCAEPVKDVLKDRCAKGMTLPGAAAASGRGLAHYAPRALGKTAWRRDKMQPSGSAHRSRLHRLEGAARASLADTGARLTWRVRPCEVQMAGCSASWSRSMTGPTAPSPSPAERRCFGASGEIAEQPHPGIARTYRRSSAVGEGAGRRQAVEPGMPSARSPSGDQAGPTVTGPTEDDAALGDSVDVLAAPLELSAASSARFENLRPGQL